MWRDELEWVLMSGHFAVFLHFFKVLTLIRLTALNLSAIVLKVDIIAELFAVFNLSITTTPGS